MAYFIIILASYDRLLKSGLTLCHSRLTTIIARFPLIERPFVALYSLRSFDAPLTPFGALPSLFLVGLWPHWPLPPANQWDFGYK